MLQVNGISLHLEDHGSGRPVLLLHGWPDSSYLWRNQIPLLVANGFRAIAPDLRGLGRSDRPEGVAAYSLQNAVGDVVGILDASGIEAADIVGHDLGSRRGVVHCHGPSASRTQARSRRSSCEEAYRWDKRARQSAPRLEIRSCVRSTGGLG